MTSSYLALLAHGAAAGAVLLWGRNLGNRDDDALLAERWTAFQTRAVQTLTVAFVMSVMAFGISPLWLVPVIALLLAILYPVRRRVLQESWTLLEYLGFQLRFVLAASGYWLLLGLAPAAVVGLPLETLVAAAIVAALAGAWLMLGSLLFLRLLGAEPLQDEELASHFAPVLERARCACSPAAIRTALPPWASCRARSRSSRTAAGRHT